jgi:glycosyltransferase involved in cell wall biosynthesis
MILSDAPSAPTGLGRITRDLATRIAAMPEFRVATLGYGSTGSKHLPFQQYFIYQMQDWVVGCLPEAWADFAGDEKGILLVIWDASRLLWLAQPELYCRDAKIKNFLATKPFKLWTYSAIDATGPNDRLSVLLREVLRGFDRILAYSEWSARIIERTLDNGKTIDALPHGFDASLWRPIMREKARRKFGEFMFGTPEFSMPEDALVIGIVATNQRRKDWGTAIEAAALLSKTEKVMLWISTDVPEREWSMSALLMDYGLNNQVVLQHGNQLTDEQLKWGYSACDVTWAIGLGEGMGMPIFESLACGTPCIHGNYGGAPEFMPKELLIEPLAYRKEQMFGSVRPVFHAEQWVEATLRVLGMKVELPSELDWTNLWPRYEQWLKEGLA